MEISNAGCLIILAISSIYSEYKYAVFNIFVARANRYNAPMLDYTTILLTVIVSYGVCIFNLNSAMIFNALILCASILI